MTTTAQQLVRLYAEDPDAAKALFDRGERIVFHVRHVKLCARMIDSLDLSEGRYSTLRAVSATPSRISLDYGLLKGVVLEPAHVGHDADEPTVQAMTGIELAGLALALFAIGVTAGQMLEGILDDDQAAVSVENGEGTVNIIVNGE